LVKFTLTAADPVTVPTVAVALTVADDEGNKATASDSATVTVTNVAPTVTLGKTVAPSSLPEPGGVFTYTLRITNTCPSG
jgi:hypothetical protein